MTRHRDDLLETLPGWLQQALAQLPKETALPAGLQGRVLNALARAGALRLQRSWRISQISAPWLSAAAVAVLALGIGLGSLLGGPPGESSQEAAREPWILILYADGSYGTTSPVTREERVREYSAWARRLDAAGALESSGELPEEGILLETVGGRVVEAATVPHSDLGIVAGYFLLRAGSREEALAFARDCPFLRHGGRISLRRVAIG